MIDIRATPPIATVEIADNPVLLALVAGVFFVVVFAAVCAAYFLLKKMKIGPAGETTWSQIFGVRLPVSNRAFDRLADAAESAVSMPGMTPERRARWDGLARSRRAALGVYRVLMIFVGLAAVVFAVVLFSDATPGNMLGLPAGIALLLGLGALLTGLLPNRGLREPKPIDGPRPDRFDIRVSRPPSTTLSLSEQGVELAAQVLSQGLPLEEAARVAYSGYGSLDEMEKQALLRALEKSIKALKTERRESGP